MRAKIEVFAEEELANSGKFWQHFETEFQDSVSSWNLIYMAESPEFKRVAYSPGEFAKLFGKSQTWGYRQIYAGKVKAITEHGRILIPAAEVDAILKTAGIYDGLKVKAVSSKREIHALVPQMKNVWQSFLSARRKQAPSKNPLALSPVVKKWPSAPSERQNAMARLSQRK